MRALPWIDPPQEPLDDKDLLSLLRFLDELPDPLFDSDELDRPRKLPGRYRPGRRSALRERGSPLPLALLVVLAAMAATGCGDEEPDQTVPGAVLVQLRAQAMPALAPPLGAPEAPLVPLAQVGPPGLPPLLRWPLGPGESAQRACARLSADPAVDYCEPLFRFQAARLPRDPRFKDQWGLSRLGLPGAWSHGAGDARVVVALVDDGIALDHPDLAPNLWTNPGEVPGNGEDDDGDGLIDDVHGFDFVDGRPDGAASAEGWHGTHLAGIVGAAGDNGVGISGVNWQVSLMALRAFGPEGGASDRLVRALDYATAHGAQVITAAFTGPARSRAVREAIERAARAGALVVAAAGNDGGPRPLFPAEQARQVLSVGATGSDDRLASFSSRGALLGAPGVGILSTTAPGQYERADGTSQAAAHVAGLAALLFAARPQATAAQVREALVASARPLPGTVYGTPDAERALELLAEGVQRAEPEHARTLPAAPPGADGSPLALGAGCALQGGVLHAARGALCSLVPPWGSSPATRWSLPGTAERADSTLVFHLAHSGDARIAARLGGRHFEVQVEVR